jgi:hypothetical protein
MTKKQAIEKFNHPNGYIKTELRCAARATLTDLRYCPIGGMTTSATAIETLKTLGYIECARAFAVRNKLPIPMSGYVATPEGVKASGLSL